MVQLNPIPVFSAKKNSGTIWREILNEVSVQMISAQSFNSLDPMMLNDFSLQFYYIATLQLGYKLWTVTWRYLQHGELIKSFQISIPDYWYIVKAQISVSKMEISTKHKTVQSILLEHNTNKH